MDFCCVYLLRMVRVKRLCIDCGTLSKLFSTLALMDRDQSVGTIPKHFFISTVTREGECLSSISCSEDEVLAKRGL